MKRVNLRLDVTEAERDLIRRAAALGGWRSMADFCRSVVLSEAQYIDTFQQRRQMDSGSVEQSKQE